MLAACRDGNFCDVLKAANLGWRWLGLVAQWGIQGILGAGIVCLELSDSMCTAF